MKIFEDFKTSKVIGQIHSLFEDVSIFLRKVIIHTFNNEIKQKAFFLIGYQHKRGFSNRIYGDPKTAEEGGDFRWQLRNIRWHLSKYAEQINIYEDVLDDLTGFLLDTCYKCYLGSKSLSEVALDQSLLDDSLEVCFELVSAIEEAEFYQNLKEISTELKDKIKKQIDTLQDPSHPTMKALKFVEDVLLPSLVKEIGSGQEEAKPATTVLLNSVKPCFTKDLEDDSGIYADISGSTVASSSASTPMRSTPNVRGSHLLANQSMNSSMVIIDSPNVKNKPIDQLKKFSQKRSPSASKGSPPDQMDGSFLLI